MARHGHTEWTLPDAPSWDVAKLATLMDIRDELKKLNNLLGCSRFIRIPTTLEEISANTKKRTYKKKLSK